MRLFSSKTLCRNCGRKVRQLYLSKAHKVIHCGCYWDWRRSPIRYHGNEPRQPTGAGILGQLGIIPAGLVCDNENERVRKHWQPKDIPVDPLFNEGLRSLLLDLEDEKANSIRRG